MYCDHGQPARRTVVSLVDCFPDKGAITSKLKHEIKLKTSPARLAQRLQPSLGFCFSLQPMTAHRPVRRHWLQAKTNSNEGYNSCASLAGLVLSFISCFVLLVIAS